MANENNYWTKRIAQNRLSRRRFVGGAAVAGTGAATFALVGCGDDDDDDNGSGGADPTEASGGGGADPTEATGGGSSGGPQPGGEIILNSGTGDAQPLDPHTSLEGFMDIFPFIGSRFLVPNNKSISPLEGEVLESWEQVDEVTVNLKVRPGINWQSGHRADGRPLTAEDVAFNLKRIHGDLDPERSAQFQRSGTLRGQDDAVAIDENTVQITFSEPNAVYMAGMAEWRHFLTSPENVEADPNFNDPEMFDGSGPFRLDKWDTAQSVGEFLKNPEYWEDGLPYLDSIRQVALPDENASLSAFITGQTDFHITSGKTSHDLADGKRDDARWVQWDYAFWHYFDINTSRAPFDNPAVRRAINLAIDYVGVNDFIYGEGGWSASGPIPSVLPGTTPASEIMQMLGWNPDTRDEAIAEAKALLDAAGFPDGDGITLAQMVSGPVGSLYDSAIVLQNQLSEVLPGMDVKVDVAESFPDFLRRRTTGEFDVINFVEATGVSGLLHPLTRWYSPAVDSLTNFSAYNNPDVDALIEQGLAEFDVDAQTQIVSDLETILLEDSVGTILNLNKQENLVANRVRGYEEYVGPGTTLYPYTSRFGSRYLWIDEDA